MLKVLGRWAAMLAAATFATQGLAEHPAMAPRDREEAVLDFLMAEIAAQRGQPEAAVATMIELARELRDAKIARRAVELAIRARAMEPALSAAALLVELEPDSGLGRDLIASLVANQGDIAKARETIAALVEASDDKPRMLTQLSFFFAKYPDKAAALDATRVIAARHALPESRYAVGVAALLAGRYELAREESVAALAMRPGWGQAAILHAQALRRESPSEVIPYYRGFVERHPREKDARMQLARELATAGLNAEARDEFRIVEELAPKDPQVPYAIGLLSLQLNDPADAEAAFRRALDKGHPDTGSVHLGLGQAAEAAKKYDDAIAWYSKVESVDWMRAQLRIASLIAKRDGLEKGREYLQSVSPRTQEDRIQMVQIEAQLLRDAKAWKDSYDVLSRAVEQFPGSFELLYDRAMAAERVDRIDVLEADLRRVIELKPDYAHAYNALGYTLADRTDRLDEAHALITKAVSMAPDDPFILDSLGWVEYKRGNLEAALRHLKSAYGARPDPEIAAHLGEVLWKVGQRDEARKIWQAALSANPDHEALRGVIEKFRP